MSAQSLLSSVFSCSSPAAAAPAAAKSLSKRRLRQTRSLDPAIIGGCREDSEGAGRVPRVRAAGSPPGERCNPRGAPPVPGASFSTPSTPLERSPPGSVLFDEENPRGKRSPGCELPFLARTPSASALSGPANSIFSSPRRWLQQRKGQPSLPGPPPAAYVVWKSELVQWREAALYVPVDGRDDQYPQSADFAYKKHLDEQVRSAKFNPTHVSVP